MISVKEIAVKQGMTEQLVYQRLKRNNISHKKKIGHVRYYNNDVIKLIGNNQKRFFAHPKLKLKVVEYFLLFPLQPRKVTADELGIAYPRFNTIINEWEKNNYCVTVKSKL